MNKSKNNDYHVVLEYKKLHQEDKEYSEFLRSKKGQEEAMKDFAPSFVNYFPPLCPLVSTISEYYNDIVDEEKRPDYRTIEILSLLQGQCSNQFSIYNGYKVHFPSAGLDIFFEFLFKFGSTIETHLLSRLCRQAHQELYPKISISYSELQEFFNETREIINSGLKNLQVSKIITCTDKNENDITISLNKDTILKLIEESEVRNLDNLETDIKINEYYGEYVSDVFDSLDCGDLDISRLEKMIEHYKYFREKGLIRITSSLQPTPNSKTL